jgi:type IV secretory pathway VirB10-like protein
MSGDGLLTTDSPKPSLRITQSKVISIVGVTALIVILSPYLLGCGGESAKRMEETNHQLAEASFDVIKLPSSYDLLPKKKADVAQPVTPERNAALDALLAKALAEKMKREEAARRAKPSFMVELPKSSEQNSEAVAQVGSDPRNGEGLLNSRDDSNRQDEKLRFLKSQVASNTLLVQPVQEPISKYQLMAGTVIPGVLVTGINSDLPGQILGQVSQNIFDTVSGDHLLIPQGTKVIGEYDSKIVYGQERALVVWNRLIFPSGKSIFIGNMPGTDSAGYSGLTDSVNNHYGKLAAGVLITSLLGASAQMANGRGFSNVNPEYGDLAAQGAATSLNRVGERITERNLNIQPTIEIRPGFRFSIFVTKDIILEPI